jgi:hypothetical protein
VHKLSVPTSANNKVSFIIGPHWLDLVLQQQQLERAAIAYLVITRCGQHVIMVRYANRAR